VPVQISAGATVPTSSFIYQAVPRSTCQATVTKSVISGSSLSASGVKSSVQPVVASDSAGRVGLGQSFFVSTFEKVSAVVGSVGNSLSGQADQGGSSTSLGSPSKPFCQGSSGRKSSSGSKDSGGLQGLRGCHRGQCRRHQSSYSLVSAGKIRALRRGKMEVHQRLQGAKLSFSGPKVSFGPYATHLPTVGKKKNGLQRSI